MQWGQCVFLVLEKGDIGELNLDQMGVSIFNFHAFWYAAKFEKVLKSDFYRGHTSLIAYSLRLQLLHV